eukprot:2193759-Pyramimonas_sp.AAC.1
MHVVHGVAGLGLLVDTGASSALLGTDKLRIFLDKVVKPMGIMDEVSFGPFTSMFTGVEGRPEPGRQ